jgi:hypothetical protein
LYLTIRPNEPTVLGIGAGGSIVQDIERDESDPRLWDRANSKIVNIHLLDAATFRSVTGLEPPCSPINSRTYADAGLPFQMRPTPEVKSRAVSAEGAFDGLGSVDAWNRQRNETHIHGCESIFYPEAEVEDYDDNGLYIGAHNIITLDVDDTLPGLQTWPDVGIDESKGKEVEGGNEGFGIVTGKLAGWFPIQR